MSSSTAFVNLRVLYLIGALGGILFAGGIIVALTGVTSTAQLILFGQDLRPRFVGTTLALIGAVIVAMVFRSVIGSVGAGGNASSKVIGGDRVHAFSVKAGQHKLEAKLLGVDKCFYTFEIKDLSLTDRSIKLDLEMYKHVHHKNPEMVLQMGCGFGCGESIGLSTSGWKLELKKIASKRAYFEVAIAQ